MNLFTFSLIYFLTLGQFVAGQNAGQNAGQFLDIFGKIQKFAGTSKFTSVKFEVAQRKTKWAKLLIGEIQVNFGSPERSNEKVREITVLPEELNVTSLDLASFQLPHNILLCNMKNEK